MEYIPQIRRYMKYGFFAKVGKVALFAQVAEDRVAPTRDDL